MLVRINAGYSIDADGISAGVLTLVVINAVLVDIVVLLVVLGRLLMAEITSKTFLKEFEDMYILDQM